MLAHGTFSDKGALAAVCQKFGVRRLSLFGSVLRGVDTPQSDIDLLVEFEELVRPTFIDLANLEIELSSLLGGRPVDVRTAGDLSVYFRNDVMAAADLKYAS